MSETGGESDAALMKRVASGDGAACRLVVTRHLAQVVALARRMLNDAAEAEDVAQDAMLRLWQMAPRWREDAPVGAWLYRVAHNLAIDRIRRRRPMVDVDKAVDLADPTPNPAERLAQRERKAAVERAIEPTSSQQQIWEPIGPSGPPQTTNRLSTEPITQEGEHKWSVKQSATISLAPATVKATTRAASRDCSSADAQCVDDGCDASPLPA